MLLCINVEIVVEILFGVFFKGGDKGYARKGE